MEKLRELMIPKNKLTGVIPDSISRVQRFTVVQLSDNLMEGMSSYALLRTLQPLGVQTANHMSYFVVLKVTFLKASAR